MINPETAPNSAAPKQFTLDRTFNAPRDLVWKAMTEPEHLMHWWGPKGLTMMAANVDLRPGGLFHYGLAMPNGDEMWGKWLFTEVDPPQHLAYIVSFSDPQGGTTRHPMSEKWPLEMLCTTSLAEENGHTKMHMTAIAHNATEEERQTFEAGFSSMEQGFGGTYNQLEAYLATL
jgi:uncharacterized protein YndB with AHSA1/START domain